MNRILYFIVAFVGVIGVYSIFVSWYRRKLADELSLAMTSGDMEIYQKLIFSKRILYFLNPNVVHLLRASHDLSSGKSDNALKYLNAIYVNKLNLDQQIHYFQMKSTIAIEKRNRKFYLEIGKQISKFKNENNKEVFDAMIKENEINLKLYFDFDSSVIKELNELLETSEGSVKGMLYMSLAKAYYLNRQFKESENVLLKAKSLLKGSLYEDLINETLEDPSMMEN